MDGYQNNSECILDYLALFQLLSAEEVDSPKCISQWHSILGREKATNGAQLAALVLRNRFCLGERDFLLTMAALALEMDGGLRGIFRRKYGLTLPTIEYGLQLISPICPSGCETLAELTGSNPLCELLLTTSEVVGYPIERPLILCRTAFAFLTGLSVAAIPGCTLLTECNEAWLPLFENELLQVKGWYAQGTANTLYLCAPSGSGRKTLLRRACENVVYANLDALADSSPLDLDHSLREMAALAMLLEAPICASPEPSRKVFRHLERLCRHHGIPFSALVENTNLEGAKEVIRLPHRLSPEERRISWEAFAPQAAPDTIPKGAMTIGAVKETAILAHRFAASDERQIVTAEDIIRAVHMRGGSFEFGIQVQADATLEDMVLSDVVREQLELICQAVLLNDKLAAWDVPWHQKGITAVFHGPSGTGKTMAASAIAHRLGMPLLQANLSQIMDKYVGETEKHLEHLFRSARESHGILFFDEADSLFGRRTQVSTGHDKYANFSTAFLLQEIEHYDGVAILCTNLLENLDTAFLRRLQYIVPFGQPNAALREILWKKALPAERCSEGISYAILAQNVLSPAEIMVAARKAAVAALADGREAVNIFDINHALRKESKNTVVSLPKFLAEYTELRRKGM